jgi:hypothetical protein
MSFNPFLFQQREAVREVELLLVKLTKGTSGDAALLAKQLVHAKLSAADSAGKLRVAARAELELRQQLVGTHKKDFQLGSIQGCWEAFCGTGWGSASAGFG